MLPNAIRRAGRNERAFPYLLAVAYPVIILPPRTFRRVPEEVSASNVMVDADLSAALTAEELFRPIRAGTTH
jgi:hypothetical protein